MDDLDRPGRRWPLARCSATQRPRSSGSPAGKLGLALGAAEEQQRLDDLAELDRSAQGGCQGTAVFLARTLVPQGHLELADEDRQRRPQLVRGVAAEPPLPLEGDVQPGTGGR